DLLAVALSLSSSVVYHLARRLTAHPRDLAVGGELLALPKALHESLPRKAARKAVVARLLTTADRPCARVQHSIEASAVQIQTGECLPAPARWPHALKAIPRGQVDLDSLDLAAQPLAVSEDRFPKRRHPRVDVGDSDCGHDPGCRQLERDARAASKWFHE